jgi:hypothetical protein
VLWWGLFDNELYVEHGERRFGPYRPIGGPIPLHRYRAFKKTPTQRRSERIEALAVQLVLPRATPEGHPHAGAFAEYGWLTGGLKVLVVRYGAKYFATNRLTLPAAEVRRLYRIRAQSEEVMRVCTDQLGLRGCQARSTRAQQHHIVCCLVAFCVLERESHDCGVCIYQLKRHLSFRGRTIVFPALERLRSAA